MKSISIHTNTLFPNGAPKAPDGPSRKQLSGLNKTAHDSLIMALAESHLHEMIRREVGRVWGDYKEEMSRSLAGMIEEQLGEMFERKDKFALLQEVVAREVSERVQIHVAPDLARQINGIIKDNADLQSQIRALECVVSQMESLGPSITKEQRLERRKKGK